MPGRLRVDRVVLARAGAVGEREMPERAPVAVVKPGPRKHRILLGNGSRRLGEPSRPSGPPQRCP
ncbi:hypothetical protein GCM10018953_48680 [Streptosporangium nondiastaticum]